MLIGTKKISSYKRALSRALISALFTGFAGQALLQAQTLPEATTETSEASTTPTGFQLPQDGSWPFARRAKPKGANTIEDSYGSGKLSLRPPVLLINVASEMQLSEQTPTSGKLMHDKIAPDALFEQVKNTLTGYGVKYTIEANEAAPYTIFTDWFLCDIYEDLNDIECRLQLTCTPSGNDSCLNVKVLSLRKVDYFTEKPVKGKLQHIIRTTYTPIEETQWLQRALRLNLRTLCEALTEEVYGSLLKTWEDRKEAGWDCLLARHHDGNYIIQFQAEQKIVEPNLTTMLEKTGFTLLSAYQEENTFQTLCQLPAPPIEEGSSQSVMPLAPFEAKVSLVDCGLHTELLIEPTDRPSLTQAELNQILEAFIATVNALSKKD